MLNRCAVHAVLSLAVGVGLVAAPGAGAADFDDRDLLASTLTLDEQKPLADAQAALAAAESDLADAIGVRDAAQAEVDQATTDLADASQELQDALAEVPQDPAKIADAQAEVDAANLALADANAELLAAQAEVDAKTAVRDEKLAAVQAIESEIAKTGELVDELSDEQVHALNAALNNAYKTDLLPLDIDSDSLERLLAGDYGVREIQALTQSFEAEERFEQLAERFEDRYADTGRERFAERAEAFEAKADAMEAKFEQKLERFEAQNEAREVAEAGREHGEGLAKGHGK